MKKLLIILFVLSTFKGMSQNFYVLGKDTLTGRPGYLYKMRPLYVAGSITRLNDSTISAPVSQAWDSAKAWTVTPPTNWIYRLNGLTTTVTNVINLADTTAATSGVQNQNSPALMFEGRHWTGSLSQRDSAQIVFKPSSGTPILDFYFNGQSKIQFSQTPTITVGGGSQIFTSSILTTTFTGNTINSSANNTTFTLQDRAYTAGTVVGINALTGTVTNTSGGYTGITFKPTINEASGSATNDIVVINPTLTAVGSGGINLLRIQASSVDKLLVDRNGKITFDATNTAAGTTGAQTINKPSGTVNIAASGASVVVTNSLVTTSSLVTAFCRTNDANKTRVYAIVPAAGSFTIYVDPVPAAEISVGFIVYN